MNPANIHKMAASAIDELIAAVEAGHSQKLKDYLAMLGRFHRYSVGNLFLIMAQCPQASRVAGYRTWQSLGRQVRRGSKAIRILAPIIRKDSQTKDKEEERVFGFRAASVLDISQTDGKQLAKFASARGDPGKYADRLRDFVTNRGIKLHYSDKLGGAEGVSRNGEIVLRKGLSPAEEFSVMVHETAHCLLHFDAGGPIADSKTVRETEAEAVAFVVCEAAGLQAKSSAVDYIQLYQGDKDTLLESLERIHQTAAAIIHGLLPEERKAAA